MTRDPHGPLSSAQHSGVPASQWTRRDWLKRSGAGFGMLGLASVLGDDLRADDSSSVDPLAIKSPHFPVKAKRIIHLFMNGGPSHVDTFDPKPELNR